ncbi:MAG: hypothetical protein QM655_07065 [Nocardioidaceae bacterium]
MTDSSQGIVAAPPSAPRKRIEDFAVRLRRNAPGGSRSLRNRVAELEAEVQESRRLNRRVAELLDVVEELLVPLSERDEAKVRAFLDRHAAGL